MRPINKGTSPFSATTHGAYQATLFERIGPYCSYCEMPLPHDIEIEHKLPKDLYPIYKNEYKNLVLSCKNCNTHKGANNRGIAYKTCYWPDLHNPFYYLDYTAGVIKIRTGLLPVQQVKIRNTLNLTQLNKRPIDAVKDQRWQLRLRAYSLAQKSLDRLNANNDREMRDYILDVAKTTGFWSVWMTVFHNDPLMLCDLINYFPGTYTNCFDAINNFSALTRP